MLFNWLKEKIVKKKGRSYGYGWRQVRGEHIKENPYCAICGYYSLSNDVHHIIPRHIAPDLIYDKRNLITLCSKYKCHLRFGHFGNWSKFYNPDIKELSQTGVVMRRIEESIQKE